MATMTKSQEQLSLIKYNTQYIPDACLSSYLQAIGKVIHHWTQTSEREHWD